VSAMRFFAFFCFFVLGIFWGMGIFVFLFWGFFGEWGPVWGRFYNFPSIVCSL
jgi:hypothetical protein